MTALEIKIIEALSACQMWQGTNTYNFIQGMSEKVAMNEAEDYELTDSQRDFLYDILHRYRRQEPVEKLHRLHCRNEKCQKEMRHAELLADHLARHPQLTLF